MKVKFGVIGADPKLRANFIFQNFSREKGELVMVCDCDPEKLDSFREAYPEFASIRTCTDYRDMVCDPEVQGIFIAVRDQYHEEMAVAALEAGKAVYLEKPMAITIEGCDRILETAYRTGSKLMIGHNTKVQFLVKSNF